MFEDNERDLLRLLNDDYSDVRESKREELQIKPKGLQIKIKQVETTEVEKLPAKGPSVTEEGRLAHKQQQDRKKILPILRQSKAEGVQSNPSNPSVSTIAAAASPSVRSKFVDTYSKMVPAQGFNKREYREKFRQYYFNLSKLESEYQETYESTRKQYRLDEEETTPEQKKATRKTSSSDMLKVKLKDSAVDYATLE